MGLQSIDIGVIFLAIAIGIIYRKYLLWRSSLDYINPSERDRVLESTRFQHHRQSGLLLESIDSDDND